MTAMAVKTRWSALRTLSARLFGDSITGDGAANTIDGGAGDDVVFGGGGDDLILGSAGADTVDGEAGSDTMDYSGMTRRCRASTSR